jgi:hypothetical protein
MKTLEHMQLRGAIEVDQHVAAEQDGDARDRRIVDGVALAEDHQPAQLAADAVVLAFERGEVLRAQLFGEPPQQMRRVLATPGNG